MNTSSPLLCGRARLDKVLMMACALLLGACASLPEPTAAEATLAADQPKLDNQPTYLSLVRQMQGNGMWFASLAHIDALEQRWGATTTSRLLRADALRHTGQLDASAALYEQLRTGPERAAAYRGLGLLAGARNDYAQAVELFESARGLLPADGLLLSDLGYALLMSGRAETARLPIMQAAQLLPGHPRARSNLALYLFTQGQAQAARQVMDEARLSDSTREAIEQLAQEIAPGRYTSLQSHAGLSSNRLRLSQTLSLPPVPDTP